MLSSRATAMLLVASLAGAAPSAGPGAGGQTAVDPARQRLIGAQREATALLERAARPDTPAESKAGAWREAAARLRALAGDPSADAAAAGPLSADVRQALRAAADRVAAATADTRLDAAPILALLERARVQLEGEAALGLTFQGSFSQSKMKDPVYGGHATGMGPAPGPAPAAGAVGASPAVFEEAAALPAIAYSGGPTKDHILESAGNGIALLDYDGDGRLDVYVVTGAELTPARERVAHRNALYRNLGGWKFEDVSARAGVDAAAWSFGACAGDADGDGRLDLYITTWGANLLYRNKGDGTFEDVTAKAGLFDVTSKSLGVTLLDYDQDGWPDVFVANDTQPNKLYRNNRNGTFSELGLKAGVAFSEEGRARAGMGVDAADLDGTGRPSVAVTNFSGEMLGLFRPDATGLYQDSAPRSDVGRATRQTLGWGCFFFDVDLDGQQDLLVVNGRLDPIRGAAAGTSDTPHLFHNVGGRFVDVARAVGDAFAQPKMGRGAAFADVDADGDLDTVVTTNGGPVHLYRTDLQAPHRSVRLRLVGTVSNRDGIGARVTARVGKTSASRMVRTGSSYLSQSELPLTFGLGTAAKAEDVTVQWPSGRRDHLGALDAGVEYTVTEGKGVTGKRTVGRAR